MLVMALKILEGIKEETVGTFLFWFRDEQVKVWYMMVFKNSCFVGTFLNEFERKYS